MIENVDVFDGDEDTVSTEFIDLDANGNVEDISVCVSLNATAADCAVVCEEVNWKGASSDDVLSRDHSSYSTQRIPIRQMVRIYSIFTRRLSRSTTSP